MEQNQNTIDNPYRLPWNRIARVLALLFAGTLLFAGGIINWTKSENRMLTNANNDLIETNKSLTVQIEQSDKQNADLQNTLKEKQTRIDLLEKELFDTKVENASLRASTRRSASVESPVPNN